MPKGTSVSDTDSFIDEVNEEVRRDRLFALIKRYGWIAVVLVLAIVGGAAWNEWQKSKARTASEAFGDALLDALDEKSSDERIAALQAVQADTPDQKALVAFLASSEAAAGAEDPVRAAAALENLPVTGFYADMAKFKQLLLQSGQVPAAERRAGFETLAVAGNPLRLLAAEQIALTYVEEGDTKSALDQLHTILGDAEVTQGLRQRASQLIVALGGDPATAG